MKMVIAEALAAGMSYTRYRSKVTASLALPAVDAHAEALRQYTLLNESRMDRLDKKLVITDENIRIMIGLNNDYVWLIIAEGWCGDAAQTLPVMHKLAALSPHVDMKIVFRDENASLMDMFLTNGTRSIPKLIVLDKEKSTVLADWGPRPRGASDLIKSYKAQYGSIDDTAKKELHLWYAHDKGMGTQHEISEIMLNLDRRNAQNHPA